MYKEMFGLEFEKQILFYALILFACIIPESASHTNEIQF